jgi:hypothetical protein
MKNPQITVVQTIAVPYQSIQGLYAVVIRAIWNIIHIINLYKKRACKLIKKTSTAKKGLIYLFR